MKVKIPIRGSDAQGEGRFGAPRGGKTHRGVDMACYPGTEIYPVKEGIVTKIGYPYRNNYSLRYVQITDNEGLSWRYFYVEPVVELGDVVCPDTPLGVSQELPYEDITQHCHVEIRDSDGNYLDPTNMI